MLTMIDVDGEVNPYITGFLFDVQERGKEAITTWNLIGGDNL